MIKGIKLDWNGIGKSHVVKEEYVSSMSYLTFMSQGYHRGYRYGNPYSEFTVQGPNGPYIDCVYDPLFAEIDEKVDTSIRLLTHDQTPVLDYSYGGLKVAGWSIANYPVHSTDGIRERLEFKYIPDELELIHPAWVWDAVEVLFPKYALANRPQPTEKRPYVNVGTIGHIAYPTLQVKSRF